MNKLVTVTNKEVIEKLKQENVTLLYPLKFFCIGFLEYFNIEEIDEYCLINRILTDEDLDKLEVVLKASHIKGIVFDDLGVLEVVKDMNITKILLLDHIACNHESINYYLQYVDSVVVSSDLSYDEIVKIVDLSCKPVVLSVFSLKGLMYSRRCLINNYYDYHKLPNKGALYPSIEDKKFVALSEDLGTKFYAYLYYCALELLKLDNVLFYWYNPILLEKDKIIDLVVNDSTLGIPCSKIFLDKKLIYKVGDDNA